jgi:polyisoprenoid-binding protein YceI
MKRTLPILALLLLALPARAQDHVDLKAESRFWIEGSTFATKFTCKVLSVDGHGQFDERGNSLGADSGRAAAGSITVLVANFDCGHKPMTKDLRETLKGDEFPKITFRLVSASLASGQLTGDGATAKAVGFLTIGGETREVDITSTVIPQDDNQFRVFGSRRLLLTDFGIEPPTKLLGLIKVRNEIDVFFDLVAAPRSGGSGS